MGELRRDPITGRWVIIEIDRVKNPSDYEVEACQERRSLSVLPG